MRSFEPIQAPMLLEMTKHCKRCESDLPLDDFWSNGKYFNSYCRRCDADRRADYTKRKRQVTLEGEPCSMDETDAYEVKEEIFPDPDHLYIFMNPKISGEVKIGRSKDPTIRAKELSKSQNFSLVIHATYAGQGFLEALIHRRLQKIRVHDCEGREWFHIDPETAHHIVYGIIQEASLGCI